MDPVFTEKINILIVDDNNAPFILPLIRSFSGQKNIHLYALVFSEKKPNLFRYSRYLREVYSIRGTIQDHFESGVKETIVRCQAHLVIPTREWISQLFAKNASWLNGMVKVHPISGESTIETTMDKIKLNQWLIDHGFPHSWALPINQGGLNDIDVAEIPFPVLVKPLTGAGGIGIKLVNDARMLSDLLAQEKKYQKDYFFQELIQGYDIDVSLFSVQGNILCHTIQKGILVGSFTFPRGIEFIRNNALLELTEKIIGQLSYTGIAHLDFRFDAKTGEYILVDFNARYWNSMQGSRLMGVNFPLLITAYTLEIQMKFPEYSTGYFYYGTAGIKKILKNVVSGNRVPIKLKNTQIPAIARDPFPELLYLIKWVMKTIF